MNRIVKQHYPASRLPADLRRGIDPAQRVTVTVVEESGQAAQLAPSLDAIFNLPGIERRSPGDIAEWLRREREGWDD